MTVSAKKKEKISDGGVFVLSFGIRFSEGRLQEGEKVNQAAV